MIKVVIIEDEFNASEALKKMLPLLMESVHVVGVASHVEEAVKLIDLRTPDLVLLDIELEDGTGFEVLNNCQFLGFKLIFTTAYNEFAIKAFKYSTIDYLLKPINPKELKQAVERASQAIKTEQEHEKMLSVLKHNLENKQEKIVLKTTENKYIVSISDIYRLEADGSYTIFYTREVKVTVSKNIKYYENLLGEQFVRCHQSHLVNTGHLRKMNKNDFLELSNGDLVPVSTRKKANIQVLLN